ncbi:MAG: LysM peptidoglycan-binding domain-containing protein [Cytophagaceae bacterium]|nr:LysM peptidoglycan-binding domain-containing protein [Cytophagaceae bacterium]
MQQKTILLYLPLLFWLNAAQAQTATYRVPRSLDFAGITVRFDDGARQVIQTDVNALMSNRRVLDTRLERILQYFPIVESIFAEEEVPTDFKYLVVQESGLVPDAVSTSNAVGFWQFKKETAGDFGMRVDAEVDERKNIHAATRSAAKYLKRNNQVMKNWISTLYSYYLGLGGIKKLVPETWMGANQIDVTDQTDRYILRCLAHKIVFEQELLTYKPTTFSFYEYRYGNGKAFSEIAAELQVDEAELRRHNRWVGGSKVPLDKEYVMLVPVASKEQLANVRSKSVGTNTRLDVTKNDLGFPVLKRMTPAVRDKKVPVFYEINGKKGILAQAGDTPAALAGRANVALSRFLSYNDMSDKDRLVAGEVYYLKKKGRKAVVPFHTTQRDQTLRQVSQVYGVRLSRLLKFNRMETIQRLQPGRVLWLQRKRPSSKPVEVIKLPDGPRSEPVPSRRPVLADEEPQTITPPQEAKPNVSKPIQSVAVNTVPPASTVPATGTPPPTNDREVDIVIPDGQTAIKRTVQSSNSRVVLIPENSTATPGTTSVPTTKPASIPTTQPTKSPGYSPAPPVRKPAGVATSPGVVYEVEKPERMTPSKPTSQTSMHTVAPGETFFSIARQYGVSVAGLREWNRYPETPALKIGQQVVVRAPDGRSPGENSGRSQPPLANKTPTKVPAANWTEHTVQPGETFFSLTRKYNVTPQNLRDWNGFAEYPTLKLGQVIKVKK